MNLNNLSIGQEFKSYRALTAYLGEKEKGGDGKILQIKEWKRYFSWEEEGYKHIITDIYDIPSEKEDGRKQGNNSKYLPYIRPILLSELLENQNELNCSKNVLLELLGIIPHRSLLQQQGKYYAPLQKFNDYPSQYINEWKCALRQETKNILDSALSSMQKNGLIDYQMELTVTDIDGEVYTGSPEDITLYREAEQAVFKIMSGSKDIYKKIRSYSDLYPNLYLRFFRELSRYLKENCRWSKCYWKYNIWLTEEKTVEPISNEQKEENRIQLNRLVRERMYHIAEKSAKNSYKKYTEEYETMKKECWGEPNKMEMKTRQFIKGEKYIKQQKKLTDVCLKL